MKSEKELAPRDLDCDAGNGISELKKRIATMEVSLKNLDERAQKIVQRIQAKYKGNYNGEQPAVSAEPASVQKKETGRLGTIIII